MVLLYAPGFTPESKPAPPNWTCLQHTWQAWDGTEWDLSHGLSGLQLMAGTRGLMDAPIVRYSQKAPAVAGSLYRGSVYDERDCFWPLKVTSGGGSVAWLQHNARFWRTLDPEQPGRWVVTQPTGERRTLTVRYIGLAEDALEDDLGLVGRQVYGINLVAENPFWLGETVTKTFTNEEGENFYGGDAGGGFGPPYFLTPGVTTATATVTNLGDVSIWPTYTVAGPYASATVAGVGFPSLAAGEWIRINTDPTDQVALDDSGADRTAELTNFSNFAEIARGATVPVPISMTGAGSVSVSITPAYRWAA